MEKLLSQLADDCSNILKSNPGPEGRVQVANLLAELDGRVVGMTSFGESAPAGDLMQHFGFTVDNVVATVQDLLQD